MVSHQKNENNFMHIEKPVLGQITQGTIFTAATAENYRDIPVWGLCITARCDVAHENKARVFNYLPVVRFEDWLLEDGARSVVERIWVDTLGTARDFLTRNGKSVSILDSYPPSEVAEMLFPMTKSDREGEKFHAIARKLTEITEARSAIPLSKKKLADIASSSKKISEKVLKELWSGQLAGYYYLTNIGDTDHPSKHGYVVLLREVHHISRSAAAAIAKGASSEDIAMARSLSQAYDFSVFDFAYPTAKLKSPWIEHLMQQFSLLFVRIGLPDPSVDSFKNLCGVLNNVE